MQEFIEENSEYDFDDNLNRSFDVMEKNSEIFNTSFLSSISLKKHSFIKGLETESI